MSQHDKKKRNLSPIEQVDEEKQREIAHEGGAAAYNETAGYAPNMPDPEHIGPQEPAKTRAHKKDDQPSGEDQRRHREPNEEQREKGTA